MSKQGHLYRDFFGHIAIHGPKLVPYGEKVVILRAKTNYSFINMNAIKNFDELLAHLKDNNVKKRVAVVWPADEKTPAACALALEAGFIEAIFVGCQDKLEANEALKPFANNISYVAASDADDAAAKAVALVREGKADILMKGLINTDNLLHAVLNKETGILPKGNVLTHVATASIPTYHKLLFFTDAAVIPYPNLKQRSEEVRYTANLARNFGVEEPKIALVHCTEKVGPKFFPFTEDYPVIVEMAQKGEFGKCIVDGPLDAKCACSMHAMEAKGLTSPLQGDSDVLIMPDIEAGNVFYKAITLFAGASTAGLLVGAKCPAVVPSRADSSQSKFYSLAVATMAAE